MKLIRYLRSLFAWKFVKEEGIWLYYRNAVTGERRAHRASQHLYGPQDTWWLAGHDDPSPRPRPPGARL